MADIGGNQFAGGGGRFVKEVFGHGPGILVRDVVGFVFLLEGIVKFGSLDKLGDGRFVKAGRLLERAGREQAVRTILSPE